MGMIDKKVSYAHFFVDRKKEHAIIKLCYVTYVS